jgi:hypothetical protein
LPPLFATFPILESAERIFDLVEVLPFSADTSPQAVLGVRLITAPYRAPDPAEHAYVRGP